MIAYQKEYTFDFVSGEMWEKSLFSIMKRKRWMQGIFLVVHLKKIQVVNKLPVQVYLYLDYDSSAHVQHVLDPSLSPPDRFLYSLSLSLSLELLNYFLSNEWGWLSILFISSLESSWFPSTYSLKILPSFGVSLEKTQVLCCSEGNQFPVFFRV